MYFGFAIASPHVDLWDIDLLDIDIPSKTFCLSPRHLQDALKTNECLPG